MVVVFVSLFGEVVAFEDVDLGAGDAAAVDGFDAERGVEVEGSYGVVKDFSGNAGVEESAEKHVSSDAGEAVEIGDAHGFSFQRLWRCKQKAGPSLAPQRAKNARCGPPPALRMTN
jgi:hypothetical protein